jgi:hypothetical protein
VIKHLTLHDIQGMSHVKRWHCSSTRRSQNLAEHSYNVAMLALKLGSLLPNPLEDEDRLQLLELALVHDIPETQFGDVPSPTKWHLRDAHGLHYDQVMDAAFWVQRGADYAPNAEATPIVRDVLHIADVLEAALFIIPEGVNHALAASVVRECRDLTARLVPELSKAVAELLAKGGAPPCLLRDEVAK